MTQTTTDPALATRRNPSWRAWLALWIPVVLALGALLSFNARLDAYLWCATRWAVGDGQYYKWADFQKAHAGDPEPAFYMRDLPPMRSKFYHRTQLFWAVCKGFGEAYSTVVAVAAIAIYYAVVCRLKCWLAGGAVAGAAVAGFLSWMIRSVDGRYRPTHTDAANQWEIFRGFYNGRDLSFPSGHATLVFATAAVLIYVFPKGRYLFLLMATLTAVSRVVQEAHFWSDVLFGSALGWTVGWVAMQCTDRYLSMQIAKRVKQ